MLETSINRADQYIQTNPGWPSSPFLWEDAAGILVLLVGVTFAYRGAA
jgi:hypothetical protein